MHCVTSEVISFVNRQCYRIVEFEVDLQAVATKKRESYWKSYFRRPISVWRSFLMARRWSCVVLWRLSVTVFYT